MVRRQPGVFTDLHIRFQPSWLFIFALVVWFLASVFLPQEYPDWPVWLHWVVGAATALMVLVTLVAHELAHTVVGRRRGVVVKGSAAIIDGASGRVLARPSRPEDELLPAMAGPLANIGLAAVLWVVGALLGRFVPPAGVFLSFATVVSLLVGVANLLPVFPLDGGWILHSLLWRATGKQAWSTTVALNTGRLTGYVAVALGAALLIQGSLIDGSWILAAGILAVSAANAEHDRQRALQSGQPFPSRPAKAPRGGRVASGGRLFTNLRRRFSGDQ